MKKSIVNKLDERQKYLLSRIPRKWDLNSDDPAPEPARIKAAKAVVNSWQKQQARKSCQATKRNEALIRKAQEAVYFSSPEKALAIVRQCEKLLKACE